MQQSLLTKLSKSRSKLNQLTFVGSGINEEPLSNKDFLASVSSFVLRLIPFRSGKRVFPCSITNFSFVLCSVFLSWLWFLRFVFLSWLWFLHQKCLFCRCWLILEILFLWYFEFCLWTIKVDMFLFSFLILSQISINESFGTLSFKAWKYFWLFWDPQFFCWEL